MVRPCALERNLQTELLDRDLAHLHLADLAGDRHWKLVDEHHVTRDLESGELAATELTNVFFCSGVRVTETHPGAQLLAVLLVRHADDLYVRDGGMGVEELLELARIDVLAAADHEVFDAADDVDVSIV